MMMLIKKLFIKLLVVAVIINVGLILVANDYYRYPFSFTKNLANVCWFYKYVTTDYTIYINEVQCDADLHHDQNQSPINKTLLVSSSQMDLINKTKEFVDDNNVKLIIYPNGTHDYMGCTSETKQCSEEPYFNYTLNARINIPPCCRKHVITMLHHVTSELRRLNVTHFMTFGLLIGWMKYKHMIPHDHDFDIIVDGNFFQSSRMDDFIKTLMTKYGHDGELNEWRRREGKIVKYKYKVFMSRVNRIFGDIWPYDNYTESASNTKSANNTRMVLMNDYCIATKDQPYENVFPLQEIIFHGLRVHVPNKIKEYLAVQYGKDAYKKEMTCKKVHDGNCIS